MDDRASEPCSIPHPAPGQAYLDHAEEMLLMLFGDVRKLVNDAELPGGWRVAAASTALEIAEVMRDLKYPPRPTCEECGRALPDCDDCGASYPKGRMPVMQSGHDEGQEPEDPEADDEDEDEAGESGTGRRPRRRPR